MHSHGRLVRNQHRGTTSQGRPRSVGLRWRTGSEIGCTAIINNVAFVRDTGSGVHGWVWAGGTQKIIVAPGAGPGEVSKHILGVSLIIPTLGHPVPAVCLRPMRSGTTQSIIETFSLLNRKCHYSEMRERAREYE